MGAGVLARMIELASNRYSMVPVVSTKACVNVTVRVFKDREQVLLTWIDWYRIGHDVMEDIKDSSLLVDIGTISNLIISPMFSPTESLK